MTKRTGPTNEHLSNLIQELKALSNKENVKIWKRIANDLEKPSRKRREVNLRRINLYAKDKETIIVPGKVLSDGDLNKRVNIAAFKFSKQALEKINKTGKALTITQLIKENPKGKKVRILG